MSTFSHRDVFCGRLKCVHRAERLSFWKEALCYLMPQTYVYTQDSRQHLCKSAITDVGLDMPDQGMVPDGAKCGEEKVMYQIDDN